MRRRQAVERAEAVLWEAYLRTPGTVVGRPSHKQIAEAADVSVSAVGSILRELRPHGLLLAREACLGLKAAGLTYTELSAFFQRPVRTIQRWVQQDRRDRAATGMPPREAEPVWLTQREGIRALAQDMLKRGGDVILRKAEDEPTQ
jgi:transposase